MKQKGFSLIELIVVGSVLAILLVVTLPELARASQRDREAEVKASIHTIQVALERYAVDSGGFYPTFLIGAERESNYLSSYFKAHMGGPYGQFSAAGTTPFACTLGLTNHPFGLRFRVADMDPLIYYNYLYKFPTNPFACPGGGLWNSAGVHPGSTGTYPYGGEHGDRMFDLGFGFGDTPQTDFILYTTESFEENEAARSGGSVVADPDLDAPGNFYYHPVFEDGKPVYMHCIDAWTELFGIRDQSGSQIDNLRVVGYFLYGYGGPGHRDSLDEGGLDYFNRMPNTNNWGDIEPAEFIINYNGGSTMHTSVGNGMGNFQTRVETTGYPACEVDPWTGAWPGGVHPDNPEKTVPASGPDGVPDWVIIEVTSGVDVLE